MDYTLLNFYFNSYSEIPHLKFPNFFDHINSKFATVCQTSISLICTWLRFFLILDPNIQFCFGHVQVTFVCVLSVSLGIHQMGCLKFSGNLNGSLRVVRNKLRLRKKHFVCGSWSHANRILPKIHVNYCTFSLALIKCVLNDEYLLITIKIQSIAPKYEPSAA